jgi:tetratricopeptide (TPR) repeat protein
MIGQTDRAIDDFTAAIRLNPNRSDTYIHRGLAWAKKRDFNRAIADFSDAIPRDPSGAFSALNDRGNAYDVSPGRAVGCLTSREFQQIRVNDLRVGRGLPRGTRPQPLAIDTRRQAGRLATLLTKSVEGRRCLL